MHVGGQKGNCERRKQFDIQLKITYQSSLPGAGLMWELDTIGVNLQDLHYIWVVGTHHMETHLCERESYTVTVLIEI